MGRAHLYGPAPTSHRAIRASPRSAIRRDPAFKRRRPIGNIMAQELRAIPYLHTAPKAIKRLEVARVRLPGPRPRKLTRNEKKLALLTFKVLNTKSDLRVEFDSLKSVGPERKQSWRIIKPNQNWEISDLSNFIFRIAAQEGLVNDAIPPFYLPAKRRKKALQSLNRHHNREKYGPTNFSERYVNTFLRQLADPRTGVLTRTR